MEVQIQSYEGETIGVELPKTVELEVTETSQVSKVILPLEQLNQLQLETGYTLNVPLFVNEGDVLVINTSDGSYISRA